MKKKKKQERKKPKKPTPVVKLIARRLFKYTFFKWMIGSYIESIPAYVQLLIFLSPLF